MHVLQIHDMFANVTHPLDRPISKDRGSCAADEVRGSPALANQNRESFSYAAPKSAIRDIRGKGVLISDVSSSREPNLIVDSVRTRNSEP